MGAIGSDFNRIIDLMAYSRLPTGQSVKPPTALFNFVAIRHYPVN